MDSDTLPTNWRGWDESEFSLEANRIRVKVTAFSVLKEVFGSGSVQIEIEDGATVADLISGLSRRYGKSFEEKTSRSLGQALRERLNLFLNGRIVKMPENLNLKLEDGDEVIVLQPVGGG